MIWLLPWEEDESARHHPWATWTLMAINIAVFLLMPKHSDAVLRAWYLEWGLIAGDPQWYQHVTSMFMHAGLMHLLGNLFFLWMFGDNVEDALGIAGFLLVYFVGGLVGNAVFVTANEHMIPAIGASGCIAAIAGAYATMFFERNVSLKVIVVVFPVYTLHMGAIWLLLLWFGMDLWRTASGQGTLPGGGGVNYVVHGVGFAFGFAVGALARLQGTMRRYAALPDGDTLWGYWPVRLEREHRAAVLRRQQHERFLEAQRQAARTSPK
jgi:membrane associated rhomboid family serine protease